MVFFLQPEIEADLKEGACLFGFCLFVLSGFFCFALFCFEKIFSWLDPGSRNRMSADEAGPDSPFPSVHLHVPMLLFLKQGSPFSSIQVPLVLVSDDNSPALQQSRMFLLKISSFSLRHQEYFNVLETLLCFSLCFS